MPNYKAHRDILRVGRGRHPGSQFLTVREGSTRFFQARNEPTFQKQPNFIRAVLPGSLHDTTFGEEGASVGDEMLDGIDVVIL